MRFPVALHFEFRCQDGTADRAYFTIRTQELGSKWPSANVWGRTLYFDLCSYNGG